MHARAGQNTLLQLYVIREGRRLAEMARHREEPMWAALDFAATNGGEFTIRDLFSVWAKAGGGGDSASYQQFSTAINNYIYKFDPRSPKAKYRNPKYKYIRVGKTEKGSVPAPLEYVSLGARGAGNVTKLRWRKGISPMRQPVVQKAPIHTEDDPVGDALDRLEKKLGRPALKASLERWKRLGDLHKITTDIMGDSQIRGKDKAYALQVAADHLLKQGKATQSQVARAEDQVDAQVGAEEPSGFEEEPTQRDAKPLFGGEGGEDEMPDDLLHGDDEGSSGGPESDEPVEPQIPSTRGQRGGHPWKFQGDKSAITHTPRTHPGGLVDPDEEPDEDSHIEPEDEPEESEPEAPSSEENEEMRGTLVDEDGNRIEVTIQYDEAEGALVADGERMYEPEDHSLEVANGVLTQEAMDALEEEGWNLVAAEQGGEETPTDGSEEPEGEPDESEPEEEGEGGDEEPPPATSSEPNDIGSTEEGEFPAYVPEPDEEGDRYERAMFILVDEGDLREDNPLWGQLRKAKDSTDAHQVIMRSGLPKNLHKYALIVARAVFENTGRDFDTGKPKNESRLLSLYGLSESPLEEPVDFNQESGLERLYRVKSDN
jgi:hypothetical protein